ncbi:hypothetical protein Y032_0013g2192 [Ancylostoma ceylanicum]|nr:hypothetical protein Y032_0013g2192 [Ancylostoma ceylanicum]
MILAIMLPLLAARATAEVACYQCYGNSMDPELNATDRGQLCSIDRLCLGESCYFNVQETGEWSAGCSERTVPPSLICTENYNETACHCMGDLCNQFKSVNETLLNFWDSQNDTAFSNVSLVLPGLPVHCIECGNVTVNGRTLWVPCAERHICRGDFCVTKRGLHPHSFCGSIWDGSDEERCLKQAGEEETCVCKTNMCNVVLSPEALEAMMKAPETVPTATTSPTTPPKTKKCKNTMKFSPNAQAVLMGQKLGQVISGGFGTDSNAVKEFNDGVDTHICNYE